MAGHSKWANIQHRKKAQDAKRGKLFTRLIREVTVAARQGGGDPDTNPALRLAIEKANKQSVPKDNIERAIKKATGEGGDGSDFEEIRYEGYAPNGVAVMVDCVSDNRNRTASEVRHAFSKHGGNLGTDGSVAFMFEQRGVITFAPGVEEDEIMEAALEGGAEDIVNHEDGMIEVLTTPQEFHGVLDALKDKELEPEEAEVTMRPETRTELKLDDAQKVDKLISALDDLDDVQNLYHNADFPDELYDEE